MGLYLRGEWYHYKKQIEGKAYYKPLKIKRGQEALLSARLKQVEEELIAKHFGLPYQYQKSISFLDYSQNYIKEKIHKKSWDRDKQRLVIIGSVWGDVPLSSIGKSHIKRLEQYLLTQKNLKPSTLNRYFELLKHLFNLAIEDSYLKENPARYYQPFVEEGVSRALSNEEIKKILNSARKIQERPLSNIQSLIYDLILFALNTGMRLSEILNVRKSYIQSDIILYPILKTKFRRRTDSRTSQKAKIIYLNPMARSIIGKQKSKDDHVFPLKYRNPNCIYFVVRKIRETSGVEDFTFHQLRHTVSTWLSSQVSLATAKMILGHSDLKTTLKYTHPGHEEGKKGVAKIETFIKESLEE